MLTDQRVSNRIAIIDVGSNSVRLVVFDGMTRAPAPIFNEKVMCGLGRDPETPAVSTPKVLKWQPPPCGVLPGCSAR